MITPEIWKSILRIFFSVRRSVEDVFAGEYKSVFRGQGLEFEEVREYMPGDDIRSIDWKVTARYGRPFVKKFSEERELTILLLLDLSASLEFGTRKSKKELAAEITALLSWAAIVNNDRIGMLMFTDQIEKFIKPQKGRNQILKLIREVLVRPVQGTRTDLKKAFDYILRMTKKRAVIFIVSDFLDEQDYGKSLRLMSKKHDIIPILINDPWETSIDFNASVYTEDTEDGSVYLFSPGNAGKISQKLEEIRHRNRETFTRTGVDYIELYTDRSYIKDLFLFFRNRFDSR